MQPKFKVGDVIIYKLLCDKDCSIEDVHTVVGLRENGKTIEGIWSQCLEDDLKNYYIASYKLKGFYAIISNGKEKDIGFLEFDEQDDYVKFSKRRNKMHFLLRVFGQEEIQCIPENRMQNMIDCGNVVIFGGSPSEEALNAASADSNNSSIKHNGMWMSLDEFTNKI